MFSPYINNNLNFIKNYFSLLLTNDKKNFPQSIILYGEDAFTQYMLALNLAKILNCTNDKSINCQCLNCNWVKANSHPAVITVSKLDFKPEDDNTKTVISVKQTQSIKNLLASTSEYYRVFILCDAEIKTPNYVEKEHIKTFKDNHFTLPFEDEQNDKYWVPKGLIRKVFQEESANSMLKSIEEPPQNTTFIFLARNKSDLIDTIISRSQCFYVPTNYTQDEDIRVIPQELKTYPQIDRLIINDIAERFITNAELANISAEEALTKFQIFIKQTALANSNNPKIVSRMIEDIKVINEAQSQIKSYIKPQPALENALYKIYKNWETISP